MAGKGWKMGEKGGEEKGEMWERKVWRGQGCYKVSKYVSN